MRSLIFTGVLAGVCGFTLSLQGQSEHCNNGYAPFSQGMSIELTSYNKSDKLTSVATHTVGEINGVGGGYDAVINTELQDDKDKFLTSSTYSVQCRETGFLLDMRSLVPTEMLSSFESMDVSISGEALSMPNDLSPGMTLPDGDMQIQVSAGGMSLMKVDFKITNRKIMSAEVRSTPAGEFRCIKISQTTTMSGMGKRSVDSTSWFAKGVGMVYSESYDKKGSVSGYTVLTKFSK